MRRRIVLLVAATTSAVVVGFLVPMCLLIINLANDRAESQAREQAQLVAGGGALMIGLGLSVAVAGRPTT